MNAYRLGIDLGSTTAKLALVDQQERLIHSIYRRHHADTRATLQSMLKEVQPVLGNMAVPVMLTGSAGMGISESCGLPFLQEVIAAAEVVKRHPQVRTLIDIGGEDAKLIFFEPGTPPDIRMNGSCAGGTGAFIDQMAGLLDLPVESLEAVAQESTRVYPIASRCGVFAKTDVQNLLSRGIPHPDILASVFHAVVYQILATLARGRETRGQVIFCGGPLTFLPSLRREFLTALEISEAEVTQVDHPELIPALGAALAAGAGRAMPLSELIAVLSGERPHASADQTRLAPLFDSQEQRAAWERERLRSQVMRVTVDDLQGRPCFLGIDSGSTTTKVCLIDEQGRLLFSQYRPNRGSALQTAADMLSGVRGLFASVSVPPIIARAAVTGYGEDLLKAAFGCDEGVVETLAHFRAAQAVEPRTSFILDIGGQDMKAIFIEDGQIKRIEINEACSSGCGTFIELFAGTLGYPVADFAVKALESSAPCDLGTRCTVFMNSKVKQALREGAAVQDISAGLAYSVIKNAMHKVLKVTDPAVFGEHILVQGGTFRNPAVHRALENITGRAAVCPDIAELMGAYGAALLALDGWQAAGRPASVFYGLTGLDTISKTEKRLIHCRGCENRCAVTRLTFPNGGVFFTGNRCEKIFTNGAKHARKGASMAGTKYRLLFDRPVEPAGSPRAVIGIPRVLNMYEHFPFWCALLVESGFRVQLSSPSQVGLYEKGAGTITSENICFPAKLTHGHIIDLIESGVDRIFYPMVMFESPEFADADGSYNCPVVYGYPELINSAVDPAGRHAVSLDKLPVNMRDTGLLRDACVHYLLSLGVDKPTARRAFEKAVDAQRLFKQQVREAGAEVIAAARAAGRPLVLLLTRPYHIDPQIHHKAPDILTDFGVDVLTEDSLPLPDEPRLDNPHVVSLWQFSNRYLYAARWAAFQPDVEVVQLNSFGCGPDAIAVDEARRILSEWGRGHTILRIDEIESTGSMRLRLRSMVESLHRRHAAAAQAEIAAPQPPPAPGFKPRRVSRPFQVADRRRTILAPDFSRFTTLPIVRPLMEMGYQVELLPPPDRQSVETGLKYANNEICYPATLLIGDVIKALQSGKYDPREVATGLNQTGGMCRETCYISLLKNALVEAGFADVPVISVSTNLHPLNEQPGFTLNYPQLIHKILLTITYADSISAMYHACAVREMVPGSALALADRYMAVLNDLTFPVTARSMPSLLQEAVRSFNDLPVIEGSRPVVGVVGEIYVRLNPFGGGGVVPWLMEQGIETVLPPLGNFFTAGIVSSSTNLKNRLFRPSKSWLIARLLEYPVTGYQQKIERVMQGFRFYRPSHSIWDIAAQAGQVLSLVNQYGEGWLIPGEIGNLVEGGIHNILCLQPFGCLPNHIVAKGIQNRLKARFPEMNLLYLDCDAGTSEVNFFNRMHFFVHHARQFA